MAAVPSGIKITSMLLCLVLLSSCYQPPWNNFQEDKRKNKTIMMGTGVGAIVGTAAGAAAGAIGAGALIGGVAGAIISYQKTTLRALLYELAQNDIQYFQYGDTHTLIIPTDRYFEFNSPKINDICYPGLVNVIRLLRNYPDSVVYVAAFTDNIGTKHHKKMLTQARAETMLTFLWAHGIPAESLQAEGYGDKHDIGDNKLIHGSAYNRRIEIQWFNVVCDDCTSAEK